jgi:hypothetical protein
MPFSHTSQPSPHAPSSRILPVVLDEPDVVALQVSPQRFERAEIQVEDIRRGGLEHHWN